jgi:hypothetical protein
MKRVRKISGTTQPPKLLRRRPEPSATVRPEPLYSPFVAAIIAAVPASIPPA